MTSITPFKEKPPKPAREIICEGCGTSFYVRTAGHTKYCIECKVDTYNIHRVASRRRQVEAQKGPRQENTALSSTPV